MRTLRFDVRSGQVRRKLRQVVVCFHVNIHTTLISWPIVPPVYFSYFTSCVLSLPLVYVTACDTSLLPNNRCM